MSKWKWISLSLLLTLAFLIAISWQSITTKAIEFFLHSSFSNVTFNGISRQNDQWVINHPRISKTESSKSMEFQASKAMFSYTLDLWKGEIDLFVSLDEPELQVSHPDPVFSTDLEHLETQAGFFKIKKHIVINHGKFKLGEYAYEVNGDLYFASSYKGHLLINFPDRSSGDFLDSHLSLKFGQDIGTTATWKLDFNCHKVECFHLLHAASYLYPALQNFQIQEGLLHGKGGVIFEPQLTVFIHGDAKIEHLKVLHVPTGVNGAWNDILLNIQPNSEGTWSIGNIAFKGEETEIIAQVNIDTDLKLDEKNEEITGCIQFLDLEGLDKPVTFGIRLLKDDENGKREFSFKEGWFDISSFPLEKYVASNFIDENLIKVSGFGDFQAHFDHQRVKVNYKAHDVKLENHALLIEIPEIRQTSQTIPVHYFDFSSGKHYGSLPIENATCLNKNNGLMFTDVNAQVAFEEKNIHASNIESFCHGIYFSGALDIDLKDIQTGYFDVDIHVPTMHGKVTQLQSLFSHFPKTFFLLKMPIEGNVSFQQEGAQIHFAFAPNDYDTQVKLKGTLTDAVVLSNSNVTLQELSLNFDYNHQANRLDFSEIQGTLLVGHTERIEEYTFVGERVHFFDCAKNCASFDLWIGDKKRDVIRLVGNTSPSKSYPEEDYIQVTLDQNLSHFGNMHPKSFHLILKDWWQIEEFRLISDFELAHLFKDLQRFGRTGFLFLSRYALKQLNDIKNAQGIFKVDIEYDQKRSQLDYHVIGENVSIDDYSFKDVLLDGKKLHDTWIIEQFVLDQFSLAADILRKSESWLINFLGIKLGKSILMGLQGEYFENSNSVNGKINLLEVDIEVLNECTRGYEFLRKCPLKGHMKASGPFHYKFKNQGIRADEWDISLNASLKDWEIQGLSLDDIDRISLQYTSDKGLLARNINTALKWGRTGSPKVDLNLETFDYDVNQDILSLENLNFSVPSSNISETINQLIQQVPNTFFSEIAEMLIKAKPNGNLEGTLNVDYSSPHYAFKLVLKDGEYRFLDRNLILSNFVLEYDPCEIKIVTKCHSHQTPFWLQYKSSNTHRGEIQITERDPSDIQTDPLVIKWQNNPNHGLAIQAASGHFHGITFNLSRDESCESKTQTHFLEGEMTFTHPEALQLISPELGEKLAVWKVGAGFTLKGKWEVEFAKDANELIKTCFVGDLEGQNFEFKGYRFEHLYAEMRTIPHQIFLNNIHMTDPSGSMDIRELRLNRLRNGIWRAVLSKAEVQNFKPNSMRKVGIDQENTKNLDSLVIRDLVLENLQGDLGRTDSFLGKGSLTFINPPKNSKDESLFTVSGELLNHLNLDASMLNPVIGTIFYEIKDSKIFLTKVKDVYSQGKMSKFYLSNHAPKSYIDFDGNLSMQIKIKQNNLFFKLAELFTITIQGSLEKPTFTLQKQK